MSSNTLSSQNQPSDSLTRSVAVDIKTGTAIPNRSPATAPRWLTRLTEPLSAVSEGLLILQLPNGDNLSFGADNGLVRATVKVNRWRALRRLLSGGTLSWSEGFVEGDWDSPNVAAVITWALANEDALTKLLAGSRISRFLSLFRHRRNANSKRGSRKNITFHYDLGNDFYRAWLDDTMTYSSALFTAPLQSLASAQATKYQNIIDELDIQDGSRVLEVGCGWGGFAEHLLQQRQVQLEGITLSHEQLAFARQRLEAAGYADTARFSLTDYRDTQGQYDHIVSIEMLEAVGQEYWDTYFKTLYQRLKPGGSAAVQVITIDEKRFRGYCESPDFIQTYIFPGGMLPSIERVQAHSGKAGLEWRGALAFGDSYARTLAEWNQRFHATWPSVSKQGFDERFRRLWRYYLEYCEGGFLAGSINVYQVFLRKPA
ncbi:cyclopropane-fatty-acyl-phospholipid synthase [Litorivivens lipolytica]|uniref:Cyclopropane-fatty-acyl-phospholipid synthase n=1 Tax=Litorivivens lipolytica TaxID=1524264 RepID=A0A7W4Z6V0_9GAMM|nr:cyclopropane-fatty-acyl-phospholipid synthase family protein [Litorivivens lipolytica]MBB3047251.1 cyclopropane-fatty-acyl-phospholipid synthase [Litorivivens lipolytica]